MTTTDKNEKKNFWFSWEPAKILNSKRVALLTLEEEGAYRRALDFCMLHGSVPRDPEKLARLIGKGCKKKVAAAILPLFIPSENDPEEVEHETVNEKVKESAQVRERKVKAGQRSAEKRQQDGNRKPTEPQQNGNRTATEPQQNGNRTATEAQQNPQQEANRSSTEGQPITVTDTVTVTKENTYVPPVRDLPSEEPQSFASDDPQAMAENFDRLFAGIAEHLPKNFNDTKRAAELLVVFCQKKQKGPRKVWDNFNDFAKNFQSWLPYAIKHEPTTAATKQPADRPVLGKISKAGARDFLGAGASRETSAD